VVTDDGVLARGDFAARAGEVLAAGAGDVAFHLRGPRTSGLRLNALASALVPLAREAGALLLVNDRVDVALAAGADGVQLGARSLSPADARGLLGGAPWVGASVHSPAQAEAAALEGADFLLAGTLYATASHPGRSGAGVGVLAEMAGSGVPLVGIGGITPARVGSVRAAGAVGVAVLRGVWDSVRPSEAVLEYLREWKGY
jgi:thiazole tautomerase (transcriptional regulator TenI)